MQADEVKEVWASGQAYERYMGAGADRCPTSSSTGSRSRRIGHGSTWFGSGALSAPLSGAQQPARVVGIDSSAGFLALPAQLRDPLRGVQTGRCSGAAL